MALSPFQTVEDRMVERETWTRPTRTYRLDFDKGRLGGIIDEIDALKQFIVKAILTARFRFPIYNDQYGCELEDLIGQDIPFGLFEAEVKRVIRDALIHDERVLEVHSFDIQRKGDKVHIAFFVDSIYGEIGEVVMI